MGKEPFRWFRWNYTITSGEKPVFNEYDGKRFLNNGLKFNMLNRNLWYWKWAFPQEKPCAQTYQILNVLLYTQKQILPVEPVAKALWDQGVGETSELTDFTH